MVSPTRKSLELNPIVEDVDAEAEQAQLALAEQINQVNNKHHQERLVDLLTSLMEDQNDCY